MTTRISTLLFPALLLTAVATSQVKPAKKDIKPTFTAGQQFEFKNTYSVDLLDAKTKTMHQEYTFTLLLDVAGKDPAGKTMIRAQYTKVSDRTEDLAKKETTGYNSEAPDEIIALSKTEALRNDNIRHRQFKEATLGKPFTIYFNESNGGFEVTGIDTLVERALQQVKGADAAYIAGFAEGIRSVFNNKELKDKLETAFSYLPGKPVGVGDGWSKNEVQEMGTLKVGYVIKSAQPDSIGILVLSTPAVNKEYGVSVVRKGNLVVDAKTGLLVRSAIREDATPIPGNTSQVSMITTVKNELRVKK